ncbi:MAG: PP2C family protein-serine/threonine phosphatase, partial [Burkholderiales bacterium]|nr:PP2C family protein-serine/threonine phosphatase [Burkholderiales bacterium]
VSKTLVRATASSGGGAPNETIEVANHILCEDNDACLFVTTFYAVFDPGDGTLTYVNAGHPPPLLIHCDGTCEFIPATGGLALGMAEGIPFSQATITLRPDDCVIIYTDGVTEAFDEKGEEFTPERLPPIFANSRPKSANDAVERIVKAVDAHAGGTPQSDDITCVALQYHRATGASTGVSQVFAVMKP